MSIMDRVKNHISDNRGKYGAAAGAGAMYGASKIDSPLVNQAGFNILAKGQNLALDVADKIDPRATVALNDLGMHKIRQEDIDASNALYNSGVAKFINPNPIDMVNANEHSTEVYNKAMAAKASAQDALVNAKNQGQDYIDQGVNYIKGLNPFTENTSTIPIKDTILENTITDIFSNIKKYFSDNISKKKLDDVKIVKNNIKNNSNNAYIKKLNENDAELALEFLKTLGTKLNINSIKDLIKTSLCMLIIEENDNITYITGFLALQLIKDKNLYLVSYSVIPNSDKNAIKILKNLIKTGFNISTGVSNKEQFNKFISLGFKKVNKDIPDLEALLILESYQPEKTMKIEIKKALLEGYTPEEITEGIIRNNAMNSFNSNTNYLLDGSGRVIGLLPFGMVPGAIMSGIAGYKVGTHGKTGAGAAVGALIGKNGAMGALSAEDEDIRLRDIYRPKNIAINATHGTLIGAGVGGLTGGPVGALGGAAIGGTLGMVSPAIQYGIGKVGGKAGNYFSK